jgi:hypothetical protein
VKYRLHPGLLLLAILALCGVIIFGVAFLRSRAMSTAEDLLVRLPSGDAPILSVDVQALRRSGILAALGGSKVSEEPEYKSFIVETGFDYQQDLDSVVAAFTKKSVYFLLRGRFDWGKLAAYVKSQDGACRNTFCRVAGSTPQRNISFFPLRSDTMALAVSTDSWAASALMAQNRKRSQISIPSTDPVWLLIPVDYLRNNDNLPAGTRLFAQAMKGAEKVLISLASENGRFEACLDVTCQSAEKAAILSVQLEGITRVLRDLIAKENKTPNPRDLSGVLAAGTFRRVDRRVVGRWPLERAFLETLAGGSL